MKIDDKVLAQALINNNNLFMENLPTNMEIHNFSKSFERKMRHLIIANNKYGGRLWMERFVSYSSKIAVISMCVLAINLVTAKAFDVDLWGIIIIKTEEFFNVNFSRPENSTVDINVARLKIAKIPDGYKLQEEYQSENLSVQSFVSDKGTLTYTESLISETADINIESGESTIKQVGNWQVNYITGEDSITAFFTDDKYYHIVEIQGADANEEFLDKIIEELEEQ